MNDLALRVGFVDPPAERRGPHYCRHAEASGGETTKKANRPKSVCQKKAQGPREGEGNGPCDRGSTSVVGCYPTI